MGQFLIPIAIMKTFLLSLALVLVTFQGSKAGNVTSCLSCSSHHNSPNPGCVEGTVKGTPCDGGADGCFVLATSGEKDGETRTGWERGCCLGNSTTAGRHGYTAECTEIHGGMMGLREDQSWCNTNDCNTMDPRSSAGALASTLTLIVAAVAFINF